MFSTKFFFREMPFSTNFIFVKCRFPPNVQQSGLPLKCNLSTTGNLRCFKLYRTHVKFKICINNSVFLIFNDWNY